MADLNELEPNTLFIEVSGAGLPEVDGLFVPSSAPAANAALPPVIQPTPAPLPAPLPVRPVAPAPPIKVSIHTWTQISTGGSSRTIVMRMVGNFRGITSPTPVRKPSRVVNAATSFQGQPRSRSAASSEFIFRGHGAFSMHIRSLPSKSFQRMSLRVGR